MRVFAGPNGSGKTTIFKKLLEEKAINLGVYINADEIQEALNQNGTLSFSDYKLMVDEPQLQAFFRQSQLSPIKKNDPVLWQKIRVDNNKFHTTTTIDAYLSADLAEFIRRELLKSGQSFTYETVMSHPGKIQFLEEAQKLGYRVYLYYIATEDPDININRVDIRVSASGHAVDAATIRKRYYRSLENLKPALKKTNRAFIFDNSGAKAFLVAEVTNGSSVNLDDLMERPPHWFEKFVLT